MEQFCQKIVIGSILGDGTIYPFNKKGEAILEYKYDDKYFSYLVWIHEKLAPLGVGEIKPHTGFHQHRFRLFPNKEIGTLRKVFYPNGKKIVPQTIKKLLVDPLSLAIWYMDDGCLDFRPKEHCNATFATFCFSWDECLLLKQTLQENFDLTVSVHRNTMRGKVYYRLYIPSSSMYRFTKLIQPFILPCFFYKIPEFSQQSR